MPGRTLVDLSQTTVTVTMRGPHDFDVVIKTNRRPPFVGRGRSPVAALKDAIKAVETDPKHLDGRPNLRHEVANRLKFG